MQWTMTWAIAATIAAAINGALAIWWWIGSRWERQMRLVQSGVLRDSIEERDRMRARLRELEGGAA
jgi:hypothetical protein